MKGRFYMEVFVINLKQDEARRIFITTQLRSLGVSFRIIDAVNGNALEQEEYNRLVDLKAVSEQRGWLTRGAVGCALSHLKVYETMVKEKIQHSLILEDDCILNTDLKQLITNVRNQLRDGEVLLLNYKSFNKIILKSVQNLNETKYSLAELAIPTHIGSSAAYIITLKAAQAMALNITPVKTPTDNWRFFVQQGFIDSLRFVYPQPIVSAPFKSSIDYVSKESLLGVVSSLVERYKLFPLYQILRYRRKRLLEKLHQVEFIP